MKTVRILLSMILLALAAAGRAELNVGDRVPHFALNDDQGNLWKIQDHLGKGYLILYFYPAAMTGGCTAQACAYRDSRSELLEMNAQLAAISGDAVRNLAIFKQEQGLNFPLLSDVTGEVTRMFGVPARDGGVIRRVVDGDSLSLERTLTPARWTFVLDENGTILFKDTAVKAAEDSKNVLEFIKSRK